MLAAVLAAAWAPAVSADGGPAGPSIGPERTAPTVEDLIREGLARGADGDLEGATEAWARLRAAYPEHPAGSLMEINTLQARKSLDYQDPQYDAAIESWAKKSLVLSERWLDRAPDEPRAHYYLGHSKYELMLLWGMEGKYYRAGTTGEEARKHLERAITMDPSLVDAKLPLGTYYYWASIATRFIRWLTWLWFIPTGEHELGMQYIEEVSRDGDLYRFDARVQLAQFYMYFEGQPDRAAPLLYELREEHPDSTFLAFEVVELRMIQCDYPGTVEEALALEATTGDRFGDAVRRRMARIWRARAELLQGHTEEAREIVASLESDWDELAPWGRRWLLLTKGNLADLSGDREEAVSYYERVTELRSRWESGRAVTLARRYLETPIETGPDQPCTTG